MEINFNQKSKNSIGYLVIEYAKLNQQLNNIPAQSFYFKSGLDANKLKLIKLKKQYFSVREFINKHSLADLISFKNEKEETLNRIDWSQVSMITRIYQGSLINNIASLKESISIKREFEILPTLNELLNDTETLILLINVSD